MADKGRVPWIPGKGIKTALRKQVTINADKDVQLTV